MKLAVVIERMRIGAGGNERSTEQIVRRLMRRGHEVTLLTGAASGVAEALPGLRVLTAGGLPTSSAAGLWWFSRWARWELERDEYDASLSMTLAVPAAVVQPRSGTARETLARNIARQPTVLRRTLREFGVAASPKQLTLLWMETRTLNHPRVKKVVAISRYVADQLFHYFAIPSRRIAMVPNAASIEPMPPEVRREIRQTLRAQLDLADEHVVFLFAAMNPGLKGLAPLMSAMSKLRREHPEARLIVAGAPSETVEADEAVRRVGPTRRIDALYAAADVTVLPTFYDPSSKVVLESLLHGTPAISTIYNGASQWIIDPLHGDAEITPWSNGRGALLKEDVQPAGRVIRDPANSDELAAACRALCDPVERQRCAVAAGNLDPRLNMDAHVEQLERLLVEVAGQGGQQDTMSA